jgi:hypothetical protein
MYINWMKLLQHREILPNWHSVVEFLVKSFSICFLIIVEK